MNPAVASAAGIPVNKRAKASALTLAGYNANLRDYQDQQYNDPRLVARGVGVYLGNSAASPFSPANNPYSRILGSSMFKPGMGALGDDIDYDFVDTLPVSPSSPPPTSSGGAGWLDVLNTAVGNVTKGLANKIGGPSTVIKQAPPPAAPSWVMPAALVAGAGALYLIFKRR